MSSIRFEENLSVKKWTFFVESAGSPSAVFHVFMLLLEELTILYYCKIIKHSIRIRCNHNLMSFKIDVKLCQRIFSNFFASSFPVKKITT